MTSTIVIAAITGFIFAFTSQFKLKLQPSCRQSIRIPSPIPHPTAHNALTGGNRRSLRGCACLRLYILLPSLF